jgi:23S rRNA (guanosine2251-2'-O)-methyltransferase
MAFGKNSRGKAPAGGRGKFGGDKAPKKSERREEGDRPAKRFERKPESDRPAKRFERKPESDRPAKRFERKPESDRPAKRFERKPESDRPAKRFERKPEGDRPVKKFERREDGNRPPKRFERKPEGDRPVKKFERREDGNRPPKRFERKPESDRPARTFAPASDSRDSFKKPAFPRDRERSFEKVVTRDASKERKAFVPHVFHIWGRRPVEAYLAELASTKAEPKAKEHVLHIIVDKSGKAPAQLRSIVELVKSFGFAMRTHESEDEQWPVSGEDGVNHQRVCLQVPSLRTYQIEDLIDIIQESKANGLKGCVGVVCDQVQDPRNFGAVLRSAAFFNTRFVVFGKDRQAAVTPHVIKASAGGAFQVKLCEVVNLSRAFKTLKDAGAWIVGASIENAVPITEIPIDRPYVLVLGNEGRGLRQEVARQCDYLARIPGGGPVVDSLNVSVAAGVFLHALRVNVEASVEE